jgi:glyoxylase I family protein
MKRGREARVSGGAEKAGGQVPFQLEGLDHLLLVVSGMQPTLDFYQQVLGCVLERRYPQWGMAQLRAGAALINLVDISVEEGAWARPEVSGGRNLDHFCIALGRHDEAALRRHLSAYDVDIIEESFHAGVRGDSLSIYVRDPSGNVIELKGPPAARTAGRG